MIRYVSTNGAVAPVDLRTALLQGQAADGGLFMPERLPRLDADLLASLTGRSYPEVARAVLGPFTEGFIEEDELARMCAEAYDFEVPLERFEHRQYIMRLDRGPTASFKDFAARLMARWFSTAMAGEPGELIILTATSGDTGGAVAHAFHHAPRVRVVLLFPIAEVSDRQRRQMTTLGGNVLALGIAGKFDDCQAMVKRAFSDPALAGLRLTSANSINIGRLLPQTVYYVYAWLQVADVSAAEPIVCSVPSGNFGDMMGAVLAWRMGLPIRRLVVATNANDEFPRFLRTGRYERVAPSRECISNAMNVGHPSNLARLVHVYGGWMDQAGVMQRPADLDAMRRDVYAVSVSDAETRRAIAEAYQAHGLILEPHGAVAWAALGDYLRAQPDERKSPAVVLETAHPAKFPEVIAQELEVQPELPPSLAGLDQKPELFETLEADYLSVRERLLRMYAQIR